ncbi:MAG: hypothetical protein HDR51_04185 [Treponema sp.]|nr:hypothetical protein [Treponema sp.]
MSKKTFCAIFTVFFCIFIAFSQSVINPVSGTWANKQVLVLDVPVGATAYYSLSGNDPESSGFVYDFPVLLDVAGDVLLKVAVVRADGSKFMRDILYTVHSAEYPEETSALNFVKTCEQNGLEEYVVGSEFSIPSSLEYSFGPPPECFEQGRVIKIDSDCVMTRYIPCTVSNGKGLWRFVMHITPAMTGIFSRRDVPFEIDNWETVLFPNKKFIYKIDDEWWQQPKRPVKLNRSESHLISWQAVDFSNDNTVRFFVLPPKPDVTIDRDTSGAVAVSTSGEAGYKFGIIDSSGNVSELYDSFKIDTFQGDLFEGACRTGVFYDSVYQGEFSVDFRVNKRVPQRPVITSSAQNNFSRNAITVNIQPAPYTELYVSTQGPVLIDSDNYNPEVLMVFQEPKYKSAKNLSVVFHQSSDGAAAYKVSAYCVDSNGNKSAVSEYTAIIDACNYYVDSSKNTPEEISVADGTKARPFASIEPVLPFLNESRFVNVILNGEVTFPSREIIISSNFQIAGKSDARILLSPETSIVVRSSSFAVENCVIVYSASKGGQAVSSNLIQLEHSVLDFNNVEFSASFVRNGTIISGDNSVINIRSSGITASAENYASAVTCVNSKLSVRNSTINTIANTCVDFSAQGGIFELRTSTCKVAGLMGRIAELFDTQSSITDNIFSAELQKSTSGGNPIYSDTHTVSLEYSKNRISGF